MRKTAEELRKLCEEAGTTVVTAEQGVSRAVFVLKELMRGHDVPLGGYTVGYGEVELPPCICRPDRAPGHRNPSCHAHGAPRKEVFIRPVLELCSPGVKPGTVLNYNDYPLSRFIQEAEAMPDEEFYGLVFNRVLQDMRKERK